MRGGAGVFVKYSLYVCEQACVLTWRWHPRSAPHHPIPLLPTSSSPSVPGFYQSSSASPLHLFSSASLPDAFATAASIAHRCIAWATHAQAALKRSDLNPTMWASRTGGGLTRADVALLALSYGSADSVFEFGVGESSLIAAQVCCLLATR